MRAWKGWTAAAETTAASTWDEWCSWLRCLLGIVQQEHARRHEGMPFSERERARLAFVRWLHQTGRLAPAQNSFD